MDPIVNKKKRDEMVEHWVKSGRDCKRQHRIYSMHGWFAVVEQFLCILFLSCQSCQGQEKAQNPVKISLKMGFSPG